MDAGFLQTLKGFKITSRKWRLTDDDFVDRLNHYYSPIIIMVFAIVICTKQYIVGQPLQCWIPVEFSKSWEKYTENYCWVKNTYFVSKHEEFPTDIEDRKQRELIYYQWVPFVLAIQAFMFFAPIMIWRLLNWNSGVHIRNIITMSNDTNNIDSEKRRSNLKNLAVHIVQLLFRVPKPSRIPNNANLLKRYRAVRVYKSDNYLVACYLLTKVAFILNVLLQFIILDAFLGPKFHFYGIRMLNDLLTGITWKESGHFPRVSFCDFRIRDQGQPRKYTVQCVLVLNLFNEKIFIFVWFWLFMMLLVNIGSVISWCYWLIWPGVKSRQIRPILNNEKVNEDMVDLFLQRMKHDCILVIRLIRLNCGEMIVNQILKAMFDDFSNLQSNENNKNSSKDDLSDIKKEPLKDSTNNAVSV